MEFDCSNSKNIRIYLFGHSDLDYVINVKVIQVETNYFLTIEQGTPDVLWEFLYF